MSSPEVHALTPDFSVAPQLCEADMAAIARMGFRALINNRPDGEGGPEQPAHAALETAARAAGLEYVYLPVVPHAYSADDIATERALLARLPKPVLAFCRTGNRSAALYQAACGGAV